jgi:hypothetical protein
MKKKTANAVGMAKKTAHVIRMEKKTAKETPLAIGFQHMLAAIVAISAIEASLAGFGIITPILSYSPANIFFAFLRIAIVVYAGSEFASSGMARAALGGSALFFASSIALCICVFAARGIATHPILGVFVWDGQLPALFATIVLENTLVGAAIAAAVAWLSQEKSFQAFLRKLFTSKKN